jgi:magnesium-transporting ATPase (P-type)
MTKNILPILIISAMLLPFVVLAEDIIVIENPLGEGTQFEDIIDRIIDFIFKIAIVLAPLMVVIGGFMIVTAAGNPQQVARARNLLIWTAIGFAIVLLSKGIIVIIKQLLGIQGG